MSIFMGLMSGTSMDGIDVAIVDVSTQQLLAGKTYPYPETLKRRIEQLTRVEDTTIAEIYQCHRLLGEAFAAAALELIHHTSFKLSEILAIGSHGQTICHAPQATPPYTVQLGCGHTISALTQLPVVADFRVGDIVLGGQGAPFAPLYHQVLFQSLENPLAILNLGGIANLTYLMPDRGVKGYDIGPANVLLDAWIFQHLGKAYDKDGAWAGQGKIIPDLLTNLLADPFFAKASPKSIGKEYYSLHWLKTFLTAEMLPEDVQATLLSLTITSVQRALEKDKVEPKRLLVCGGGVHNIKLMQLLAIALPHMDVESTAVFGVDPDFIEAMLFAWLASKNLAREPVDLRMITGSKEQSILGCLYY